MKQWFRKLYNIVFRWVQPLYRIYVKWRLKRITNAFHRAWQEANNRMIRAGMGRPERRQFKRALLQGHTQVVDQILRGVE